MVVAVADTHTTLWYLFSDLRLGRAASAFIHRFVTVARLRLGSTVSPTPKSSGS
jgi:PIN domain nuclease of toxin-antitoxin system